MKQISLQHNTQGLYIHIPFCRYLCPYCDFFKTSQKNISHHLFVNSLIKEFEQLNIKKKTLQTVYLGGGTPSLLNLNELTRLTTFLQKFTQEKTEWTLEVNPEDVTPQWTETLSLLPFNRFSLGIQSFQKKELQKLNRLHTPEQAITSCQLIQKKKPQAIISVDLICCLPEQKWEDIQKNINTADQLQLNHISIYNLSLDKGSLWGDLKEKGKLKIKELSDDKQAHLLEKTFHFMEKKGFTQYELSNFARHNCFSQHNLRYWKRLSTLAIGPGAVSFNSQSQIRTLNTSSIQNYLQSPNHWTYKTEKLSDYDQLFETIMVGMRSLEGLSINHLPNSIQPTLKLWEKNQYIYIQGDNFYLSKKGLLIYNSLVVELVNQIY